MYTIACVHAQMISKSNDGAKAASLAMEWLKKVVAAGFKDVEEMKKATALDPLRNREDFKKIVAEMESKKQDKE